MSELDQQQREYLRAMGIQTWLPRDACEEEIVTVKPAAVSKDGSSTPASVNNSLSRGERLAEIDALLGSDRSKKAPRKRAEVQRPELKESVPLIEGCDNLDWKGLQSRVRQCTACDLHQTRTQTVFGVGSQQADWLVIGEAPGADEDRQGEPFVGPAGQLLNKMLQAIGLEREQVYIANILKCRPPNNRDPRPDEVEHCERFLKRQVQLLQPKLILAFGRIAAQNLLKTNSSLGQLRGKVHQYECGKESGDSDHTFSEVPVIVTYHPAYLLRSPKEKRKAWEDLQFAQKTFTEL